jgi:hypothetical protein
MRPVVCRAPPITEITTLSLECGVKEEEEEGDEQRGVKEEGGEGDGQKVALWSTRWHSRSTIFSVCGGEGRIKLREARECLFVHKFYVIKALSRHGIISKMMMIPSNVL